MDHIISEKPHAVCMPYPAQGHINAMMQFAKLLHLDGFHITFVHTEFNYNRILKSSGGATAIEGLPDFRFETIPDGLPPSDIDVPQDVQQLCESTQKNCAVPFRNLVARLKETSSGVPPVTCIISDFVATKFTLLASNEFQISKVIFCSVSACGFWAFVHYKHLIERGLVPLKGESDLNTTIDWIPGFKNIQMKHLPSFIRTTNPNDFFLNFVIDEIQNALQASAMIINSFNELEQKVLDAMPLLLPPIYAIGPLTLLLKEMPRSPLPSAGSNLWKEDHSCLQWLEGRKAGSVIYLNFGSITVMNNEHLLEFAWGLANSKHDFLWVIRPNLVNGDTPLLPPEFVEETKGRGLIVSWCPQEQVLSHPAVGGFLTHCGWNSMMESLCAGVPMLCWPFFADQPTNCYFACSEWGVGMEIDNNVKRDEVEGLIRELMDGEKGKEMRNKALDLKDKATRATKPDGSSFKSSKRVIDEVLLSNKRI